MKTDTIDLSQRQAAILTGFGLLFMFISGIFTSTPEATAILEDAVASQNTIRMNIVGIIMMLVFDVIVALGLYAFLKPVNKSFSMLSAFFRLLHVAIYGASIIYLLFVSRLLYNLDDLSDLNTDELQTQIMLFLKGHEYGFHIGLVFFGFHLLVLGYLFIKSTYVPKILGAFFIIVALGYLINSFVSFLVPTYENFQTLMQQIVFIPAIIAELSLCIWLLLKGGKATPTATNNL